MVGRAYGDEDIPEPGVRDAVIVGLFDIGTQLHGGTDPARKVIIQFELSSCGRPDPWWIYEQVKLAFSKYSKLRLFVEGMMGRCFSEREVQSFNLVDILGRECTVHVFHETKDGKVRARIHGVLPCIAHGRIKSPLRVFSVDQLENAAELGEAKLPEWMAGMVAKSVEYQKLRP